MKYLFSCIIIVMFNVTMVYPQGKRISLNHISMLDSLLVQLDTVRVRMYLQNDSLTISNYFLSTSCDWDSVKSGYENILCRIKKELSRIDTLKIIVPFQSIRSMEDRFRGFYAGLYAEQAFAKFNKGRLSEDTSAAYAFYFIAKFLRDNYINNEKLRVLSNADQVELILKDNDVLLNPLANERGIKEQHNLLKRRLSEAAKFIDCYKLEDKTAPVFRCVVPTGEVDPATRPLVQWMDKRYGKYEIELHRQQDQLEYEEESKFKEMRYSIGIGAGGLIAFREFSRPYLFLSNYWGKPTRFDLNKETSEVFGYSASVSFSWYIKDNFILETYFSYSSTKRDKWTYAYGFDKFNFESLSPIKYYSFSLICNYLLRVKTGFRPIVGAGINYFTTRLSQSSTFSYTFNEYTYECISSPSSSESVRIVTRVGIEYIPSEKSVFSYSLLVDGLICVVSPQKEKPFVILPSVRLSWLL
jgi:hypothetical protein